MKTKGYYWHVHHNFPMQWTWFVKERIDYIKTSKPIWERPRRLALLKPVKNPPEDLLQILTPLSEHWIAHHLPTIERLHAKECGCAFFEQDWDIFSFKERLTETAPRLPRKPAKPGKGQKRKPTPP